MANTDKRSIVHNFIVHTDVSFSEDEHLGGFPRNKP